MITFDYSYNTNTVSVCSRIDCTRMLFVNGLKLRNREALKEISNSRCTGCTGTRLGELA